MAVSFAIADQKHRAELAAVTRPEAPKIFRAGTSAEVRKMMEQAADRELEKEN